MVERSESEGGVTVVVDETEQWGQVPVVEIGAMVVVEEAVHGGGHCGYGQGNCIGPAMERSIQKAANNGAGAAQQRR